MTALIIILIILAALCAILVYFFRLTCVAKKHRTTNDEMLASRRKHLPTYAADFEKGFAWAAAQESEEWEITSYDGLKLRADYIDHPERRAVIAMFHGYRSIPLGDFSVVMDYYYSLGYSLLLVHQRAHGKSEGKYITYGVRERFDCRDWCKKIDEMLPGVPVIMDGVSMGCSTVLGAAGLELPDNVRGIIADCGFTSPGEIIAHVMKLWFKLPKFPFYYIMNGLCRLFAGFSFNEFSTVEAMKNNRLPIDFIHGKDDDFVPPEMTVRAYEACTASKRLTIVEKAGHGESYLVDRENCKKSLVEFIESNIK